MEVTTWQQSMLYLGINLIYAVVALLVSVIALLLIDRYVYTQIDFMDEIKKGNLAASIFHSTLLLFIALVVAVVMS
jgi:uncharacterized membrane protein YjfL (UPF0719 family)